MSTTCCICTLSSLALILEQSRAGQAGWADFPNGESVVCGDDEPLTQDHCHGISLQVGTNWKDVLRKLSVDEIIIQNLDDGYKNCKVIEKCYQGLLEWRRRVGPQNATTKKLCDALRLVGCSEALKTLSTMSVSQKYDK